MLAFWKHIVICAGNEERYNYLLYALKCTDPKSKSAAHFDSDLYKKHRTSKYFSNLTF